jgi:hypothetical protein
VRRSASRKSFFCPLRVGCAQESWALLRECKWREDFFSLSANLRFRRLEMKIEKLKVQMTTQLAELGKETDAINQLKKTSGDPNDGATAQA